jgi:hypothetical protein
MGKYRGVDGVRVGYTYANSPDAAMATHRKAQAKVVLHGALDSGLAAPPVSWDQVTNFTTFVVSRNLEHGYIL